MKNVQTRRPRRRTFVIHSEEEVKELNAKLSRTRFILMAVCALCLIITLAEGELFLRVLNKYDKIKDERDTIGAEYKELQYINSELEAQLNAVSEGMNEASTVINDLSKELEISNKKLQDAETYISEAITAPTDKQYTPNTDLGVSDTMTAERMDRIINYWLERNGMTDSPFAGRGMTFVKASQESGLDPIFIFAIASHESAFGTSNIAKNKNNFMGIGAFDATPYKSALNMGDDIDAGIIANACWVANNYYNEGQNTLNEMIYGKKEYSTSKDQWINGINSIMKHSANIQ